MKIGLRGYIFGILYGAVVVALLAFAVIHIAYLDGVGLPANSAPVETSVATNGGQGVLDVLFGGGDQGTSVWHASPGEIILRFFVAVVLSTILVFRPRRYVSGYERGLHVAETQILLSVVAAALMLIVGDSAARAFAIFAAVALVRFRTNIRDPKEVTVLLICMALGLAAGVGRWDLGVLLCVFALVLLWFLEQAEPEFVLRPMELKLKTRDAEKTKETVEDLLREKDIESDLLRLRQSEDSSSQVIFLTRLQLSMSTDELSEEIMERDEGLIESISWKMSKKSKTLYQH
ncbi:MAG: MgtC/SapB family protein [Acidobacteriota bacterium]|nr:MAG: MgtC/SapB family protein [Acidobacteriota bacterium]